MIFSKKKLPRGTDSSSTCLKKELPKKVTLATATEMITVAGNEGLSGPKKRKETESLTKNKQKQRKGKKTNVGNDIKTRMIRHRSKKERIEKRKNRNRNKSRRKCTMPNHIFKSDRIAMLSSFFRIVLRLPTF